MLTHIRLAKRALLIMAGLGIILTPTTVLAASTKTNTTSSKSSSASSTAKSTPSTQEVTQGYGSATALQKGLIVKLDPKNASNVVALDSASAAQMLGVVVAANDTPVTLSNNSNANQVFVTTNGSVNVLVSNQNGPIKSGDFITVSAIAGIGMKDDDVQAYVLGKATSGFTGTSGVLGSTKLKDSLGHQISVSLGEVSMAIGIEHNPLQQSSAKTLPSFLKTAAELVTNKPVDPTRVYLGLVVLIATSFVSGAILYSGIRGGLIAIGRNPLAKKQIVRGILRVVLSGLIVFIIGVFGVYLLLRL